MGDIKIHLQARDPDIADMVLLCAKRELDFGTLCERVAAMGYSTRSLHEMVVAVESHLESK